MITANNIDTLYKITSNLSYDDYQSALNSYKLHHKTIGAGGFSCSLSDDTKEARDYYGIACQRDITTEQEEAVKAYLLKIRFSRPDLIEKTNGNYEQWKRAKATI